MTAAAPPDGAGPVRDEDAFDIERVAGWLRENATDTTGLAGIPTVGQFGGGASNLTYLLRYAASPTFPSGRDLVLRRPPVGTKAKGAHDMRREHDLQAALAPAFPLVPRMVAYCQDEAILGSDFYVMERVEGLILRRDIPPELGLSADATRRLCVTAIDTLADLHAVDVDAAGLSALGRGPGYVARQVAGWSERYRRARTPDVPDAETVMAWLAGHQPPDRGTALIHNDFRFDNLVLDAAEPTRIVGVLDWELATVGDPLMDLGSALAYWVQADDDPVMRRLRRQPTHAPGMLTRAEVVEHYADRAGLEVSTEQWRFYEVFGLFRLAVIAQQIHFRFFHGQTTNPAFAEFGAAVAYLDHRSRSVLGLPEPGEDPERTLNVG